MTFAIGLIECWLGTGEEKGCCAARGSFRSSLLASSKSASHRKKRMWNPAAVLFNVYGLLS